MRRLTRYTSCGVLLLLATVTALWTWARLSGPSPEQRAGLAAMHRQAPQGRNAFPALWLMGLDVPQDQVEAVMQADRRAFAAIADPVERARFESLAQARYRRWTLDEGDQALTCDKQTDCLARITADPAPYRALVARHAGHIARVRRVSGFDYSRSPWPPAELLPAYGPQRQGLRLAAVEDMLAFAEGDQARALGNVCGLTLALRRLMRSPETLLDSAVFRTSASELARVSAQMVAAFPADEALPPECEPAFAPATVQEMSLCEPMRGEFVFASRMMQPGRGDEGADAEREARGQAFLPLVFDRDNTDAQLAAKYAAACSSGVARQIALDEPADWRWTPRSRWRLECVANIAGCVLMEISANYAPYQHGLQDFGAQLRLVAALAWLHDHPEPALSMEQRVGRLPPELRGAHRPIELVDGGHALRVRMYWTRDGEYWSVPLGG